MLFFDASYGDLPLLIASISTEDGRDIAVQSPARGDLHFLQDRGAKLGKVDCEILFVDEPGRASAIDRFREFRALVATGEPQIFTHPLIGSFSARAEGGKHESRSDTSQITYNCVFLPEENPDPIFPSGAGVAPAAGIEAVSVAADLATVELTAIGLPSADLATIGLPASIVENMRTWRDAIDLDSQSVFVGIASMTNTINEAIDAHDLATDLSRWNSYRAMVGLSSAVRRAGEALTSDAARVYTVRVTTPRPLRAICAEVYGPEDAEERTEDVARLNRIRSPGLVPAGTTLKLPVDGAR